MDAPSRAKALFTDAYAAYPLLELRRFAGAPSSAGSVLTTTGSALTATDGVRFRFPGDETDEFFDLSLIHI